MLREKYKLLSNLLKAADLLSVTAAFFISVYVRNTVFTASRGDINLHEHLHLLELALPIFFVSFHCAGLYRMIRIPPLIEELRHVLVATFWSMVGILVLSFALRYIFVSRLFFAVFIATSFLLVAGVRLLGRLLLRSARRRGFNSRNLLIIGTGKRAAEIYGTLQENSHWGFRSLGFIAESGAAARTKEGLAEKGLQGHVRGGLGDLTGLLQSEVVDGVVFALSHERLSEFKSAFDSCAELGIPIYVYARPFDDYAGPVMVEDFAGIPLISFPQTRPDDYQLFFKRVLDIMVSACGLLVLLPLLPSIAMLIKITSDGPVFFSQTRVGKNGRLFKLYKFRTMVKEAEQLRADLSGLNEIDGPAFKMALDPRITPVGAWLRRSSIDEFPQFWNVFLGDMSLVGPRPPLPSEVAQYEKWHRRRLSIKPGLTCLWQVSGRHRIDFKNWMKLDLQYIDSWSWWSDVKIILRTIPALLRGQ